ncbi:MAG: enoyl-CoA hydratase/isomerase family protein [Rhodobacteraceae bacterium]|nr:enoyl-CoA hydratase/isomerase family protein [Paracoccaceae bacterium]
MADIDIRITGKAGRITLNRPQALNALTYNMVRAIEATLDDWATNSAVKLVIIDAAGEKAFCAGGDIQQMYDTAKSGDFEYGRQFWRDEYRMNAKLFNFPKPYVAFMQGFTMGGGVGISCHGSHRIVCENSQIAMPECGIGLVPDVGGSLLLARAPGSLGEYLGCTGTRMDAGNAVYAGFADYYLPRAAWPALIEVLEASADVGSIDRAALPAPNAALKAEQPEIDRNFNGKTVADIIRGFKGSDWEKATEKALRRNCPLSVECTLAMVRRVRGLDTIEGALGMEYRFTHRSASKGDFVEGIRAAIIDKDRNPQWNPATLEAVTPLQVSKMLMPLGDEALKL